MVSLNFIQFSLLWVQSFVYTHLVIGLNTVFFFVYTQLKVKTLLFRIIQFNMSTNLNDSKYCYVSLIYQLKINVLFTYCCDRMCSNSFPFVLAPLRWSLCLFWLETYTKGLRTRFPTRLEVEEGRNVREKTERAINKAGQKKTVGLR